MSPQKSVAGPSHLQQTPRNTRNTLHRTDVHQQPPPIYAQSDGRDRSVASNSRSASPRKGSLRRPSHPSDPDEEEEAIENPNGKFRAQVPDQGEDDFVCLDTPVQSFTNASKPGTYTMVSERTRARQRSMEHSPTRPVVDYTDLKGKGKAAGKELFATRPPAVNTHTTRLPTGSASPTKSNVGVGPIDIKGKGKYVEVDDDHPGPAQADVPEAEIRHLLTIEPTRKVIPSSNLQKDTLRCETKVLRCVDKAGVRRKMHVYQVELDSLGISLGRKHDRRPLFIHVSNILETQVRPHIFRR